MFGRFVFLLILNCAIFGQGAWAGAKEAKDIPCFANSEPRLFYIVQERGAIYEKSTRMNFVYPDGETKDKVVVSFYREACSKRTERLSEHRSPVGRLSISGEDQSIWIDKEGNVEFDAWATSIPRERGLKIIALLQDELAKKKASKKKN